MKPNWTVRKLPRAVALVAAAANPFIWGGVRARADEPVEECMTYQNWVAKVGNQRAVASAACPTLGACDDPSLRDSWIPGPSTPIVQIRIKFHIFCNDDGTDCASSPSGVAAVMTKLNSDYAPYRISFTENSAAAYFNDSTYRDFANEEEIPMKNTYADDPARQLNVYVVNILGGYNGVGTFPWDPDALGELGGIIIDDNAFSAGNATLTHECGHNLGLWHTHHGVCEVCESVWECPCETCIACYERADGVDGDITGDFASDTPPTPKNFLCSDPPGDDPCSEPPTAWAPTQVANFMGYAPQSCRTMFTSQQAGRQHCWIRDALTSWIVCMSDEDCDDQKDCTTDDCGDTLCTSTWPACVLDTPDGCCAPECTSGNDPDCYCGDATCSQDESRCLCADDCGTPPSNEILTFQLFRTSTCADGVDNDCDGYADCEDVADCASEFPPCTCTVENNPVVCVYWAGPDPPGYGADFVINSVRDSNNPDVTFFTGNGGWRVWSQVSLEDYTPANLGHVGLDPELPTDNFSVTIAHGALAGAANVASIALIAQDWAGQSNLSAGSIAGDLGGDLVLQDSEGQGGVGSFTIGGDLSGNITIPKVDTVEVKGSVSSGATITLHGFVGQKRVEFNTNGGDFAGDLALPSGLPVGAVVNIHGMLNDTASVDLNGQGLAGDLSLSGGSAYQSSISVGPLTGLVYFLDGAYSGSATFSSVEISGIIMRDATFSGSINVIGDWNGFLSFADAVFAADGVISIGGNLASGAALSFDSLLDWIAGDILVGGHISGVVEIEGTCGPGSAIIADADGTNGGDILGPVSISGVFDGSICGDNLSAGEYPLPGNITIGGKGPNMTVCGTSAGCVLADTPTADPSGVDKNRFISVVNPNTQYTAMLVTLTSLYHPEDPVPVNTPDFTCFEGQDRWVGPPELHPIIPGQPPNPTPLSNIGIYAELQDTPHYRDWSPAGLQAEFGSVDTSAIHIYGAEIIPDSVYDVKVISATACRTWASNDYSEPLTVITQRWGDIVEPAGKPSFIDIGQMVNAYKGVSGAPSRPQAKLSGDPDPSVALPVNFRDIGYCVQAFKSFAYPFAGPGECQ